MKCENCMFYEGLGGVDTWDFCRRYPPTIFWNMVRMESEIEYPVVNGETDWCGEYKQREGMNDGQSDQRQKH